MKRVWLVALLGWACGGDPSTTSDSAVDATLDAATDAALSTFVGVEPRGDALFLGVWARASNDIWLAGGDRTPTGGVLAHSDGTTLRRVSIPSSPTLWWIHGQGPAIRVCGQGGRILVKQGERWQIEPTGLPDTAILWGIWSSSPHDWWAVGGSTVAGGPKAIVLRSTGDGIWHRINDPTLQFTGNLYKVWGAGPDDIHFVGEQGYALHWNGQMLQQASTPTNDTLFTVHGQPGGPIYAVGGLTNGVVLRWAGTGWIDAGTPMGAPTFNGVRVREDGITMISGARGLLLKSHNGNWVRDPSMRAHTWPTDTFHAITWSGTAWWAVGGDFYGNAGGRVILTERPPAHDPSAVPSLDMGMPDMARPDAALPDMARPDMARPDTALPDMARPDAAIPDAEPPDVGPPCGNGQLDPDEECDDGNIQPGDGCDAHCLFECGNGYIDLNEPCEDGNRDPGDGCDENCQMEPFPEAAEPCPRFQCVEGLTCLRVARADWLPVCMEPCVTAEDCPDAYGPDVCCQPPGPQLIDRYCVAGQYLPNGCER